MLVSTCLAFSDVSAELWQYKDTFMLALSAQEEEHVHLILSYAQVKALAKAFRLLHEKALLQPLLETKHGNIFGDMTVKVVLPQEQESNTKKEEESICPPPNLSARTEAEPLSETA
ncbi:MAG: hypothetical protein H6Q67_1370 [Firmicutes bacterium]|nr:hypothetical protein [Bacillota bacterium]